MRYFIFILFLLSFTICNSQSGSVLYTYVFKYNSNITNNSDSILYFNNSESIYYNLPPVKKESNENQNDIEYDKDGNEITQVNLVQSKADIFYKNLESNKFFCGQSSIEKNLKFIYYVYEDNDVYKLPWILKEEFKLISGYNCQKAIVDFRGRDYEAWFTTDIPLPYGPWKLGGLPGLILEAYDLSKEVSFVAEEISIPDPEAINNLIKPSGNEITHKEFVETSNSERDRVGQAYLSRLPKGAKLLKRKGDTKKNTLELEYDWNE